MRGPKRPTETLRELKRARETRKWQERVKEEEQDGKKRAKERRKNSERHH